MLGNLEKMNMTIKQIRTGITGTLNTSITSLKRTEVIGREELFSTVRNQDQRRMWMDATGIKVLIVSGNSFVTDFLRGLVEAHGYETEEVQAFQETLVQETTIRPHVVFIDDSCLQMKDIKNLQQKTLHLTQAGVLTVLLVSEQTKPHIEQLSTMKFLQILDKPVDYLQIGQIMAEFVNA